MHLHRLSLHLLTSLFACKGSESRVSGALLRRGWIFYPSWLAGIPLPARPLKSIQLANSERHGRTRRRVNSVYKADGKQLIIIRKAVQTNCIRDPFGKNISHLLPSSNDKLRQPCGQSAPETSFKFLNKMPDLQKLNTDNMLLLGRRNDALLNFLLPVMTNRRTQETVK
jgi:hypothetical protein